MLDYYHPGQSGGDYDHFYSSIRFKDNLSKNFEGYDIEKLLQLEEQYYNECVNTDCSGSDRYVLQ